MSGLKVRTHREVGSVSRPEWKNNGSHRQVQSVSGERTDRCPRAGKRGGSLNRAVARPAFWSFVCGSCNGPCFGIGRKPTACPYCGATA